MTEKQYNYLVQAKADIRAAKSLLKQKIYRSAASRAYYSMFFVATALLLEKKLEFSKHSGVISAFGQHFSATKLVSPEYHKYLITAEEKRGEADYDFETIVSESDVLLLIGYAEMFDELGEKMLGAVSEEEE